MNYDIRVEGIIRQLQAWDREFGIDIWFASTDTIEFRFKTPPADYARLARRMYAFCPDIVDQGTETVERLAEELEEAQGGFLWWD